MTEYSSNITGKEDLSGQRDSPLVSVIIPTYNRAKYVTQAIDSVLAQTYRNYEIIVVNDGSTDNTREVLKRYGDNIRYIYQENAGGAAARNTAIKAAKGQWIAFLDSDDEWLPEKLATQMAHLRERPDLCAHITNATFVRPPSERVDLFELRNFPKRWSDFSVLERPLKYVLNFDIGFLPTLLVKQHSLVASGLFDPKLQKGHDRDLFLRLALHGPWGSTGVQLVRCHRRNEEGVSLSRQFHDNHMYHRKTAVCQMQKVMASSELTKGERRLVSRNLSNCLYDLGIEQLREGERIQARENFSRSIRIYPSAKSLIKYGLTLLPALAGIRLLERWRARKGPGFRF